jgi:hypothetical protein
MKTYHYAKYSDSALLDDFESSLMSLFLLLASFTSCMHYLGSMFFLNGCVYSFNVFLVVGFLGYV